MALDAMSFERDPSQVHAIVVTEGSSVGRIEDDGGGRTAGCIEPSPRVSVSVAIVE